MTNRSDSRDGAGLIAVDRAVAVIDALQQAGTATLAEVSRAAELSEPTTLRYLTALRKHHIVTRDLKDGSYHLGVRLHEWGRAAPSAVDPRSAAAIPLARLGSQLGETVELAGMDGRQLVVLAAQPGAYAVSKVAYVGEVEQWHATSVGKAILSVATEEVRESIIPGLVFTRFTPHTIDSETLLNAELERTRERGYAVDDEESEIGLRCVGVPFRGRNGEYRYAISVSGPAYRMTREREAAIADRLRATAAEVEDALGAPSGA